MMTLPAARVPYQAGSKVKRTGGVDNVDLGIIPFQRGKRQRNRRHTLDLLGIIVTDGRPVLDLAQTIGGTGAKQKSLRKRGLSAGTVSDQRNVSDLIRKILFQFTSAPFNISKNV